MGSPAKAMDSPNQKGIRIPARTYRRIFSRLEETECEEDLHCNLSLIAMLTTVSVVLDRIRKVIRSLAEAAKSTEQNSHIRRSFSEALTNQKHHVINHRKSDTAQIAPFLFIGT